MENTPKSSNPHPLKPASDFWKDYEIDAKPDHFNKIKEMQSGKHPELHQYASKMQELVGSDPKFEKKMIRGEPHVRVFRGVGGDYAKKILDAANHKPEDHDNRIWDSTIQHKNLKIPSLPMASWSTDDGVARNFAKQKSGGEGGHALVREEWKPLKNLIHSGMHQAHPGHEHAYHGDVENELVFQNPNPTETVSTKNIHVGKRSDRTDYKGQPAYHFEKPKKAK